MILFVLIGTIVCSADEGLLKQGIDSFRKGSYSEAKEKLEQGLKTGASSSSSKEAQETLDEIKKIQADSSGRREKANTLDASAVDDTVYDKEAKPGELSGPDFVADPIVPKTAPLISKRGGEVERVIGEVTRPQTYLLPQMYRRLGFPLTSPAQIEASTFYPKGREFFSRARQWPNSLSHRLKGAFYLQFDTNPAEITNDTLFVVGAQERRAVSQNFEADYGLKTPPAKRWMFGADFRNLYRNYSAEDLSQLKTYTGVPAVWASWWNAKNTELKLRYDYAYSMRPQQGTTASSHVHGPQISYGTLFRDDLQMDLAYSFKRNLYSNEFGAQGYGNTSSQHTLLLKFASVRKTSGFRSYGRVIIDRNSTKLAELSTNSYAAQYGGVFSVMDTGRIGVSGQYQLISLVNAPNERLDHQLQLNGVGSLPVFAGFSAFFETLVVRNLKFLGTGTQSYSRFMIMAGGSYELPW